MSDIIQLLPDSVANQIAAGEVIQRPASVIKELVENAVDAGAKTISVSVIDAGRTSIQVVDDGVGMSETDARLAFERHATSKIRQAADLFDLHTMGFRGEALASIAAVAQVELRTRLRGEEIGTYLTLSGSRFVSQEPCSCPEGSNFLIENLFFNVPARRKFLKSNTTELNNIITAFQRIALVYPEISFSLFSNNSEVFNLPASNTRQRIVDIFGKRLNQDLLPLEVNTTLCKLHGFVCKPESAKKKNFQQYFFVNGRYMKHPYFNKAVQTAYDRLVPSGEQVSYFLYFDVAPENIDVNIHPTKTEIKFENEQAIWQIVLAAVREAVGKFSRIPSIDFDTEGQPEIPVFNSARDIVAPKVNYDPSYNPFRQQTVKQPGHSADGWEKMFEGLENQDSAPELFPAESSTGTSSDIIDDKSPTHYQYKGTYILTAVKSGLMMIDQHRAHVRILYEKYLEQLKGHRRQPQKELFPEMVTFTPAEASIYNKVLPELESLGFELTDMGNNSYAINAVPSGIEGLNVVSLVTDMIATSLEKGVKATEEINKTLALSLSRNAAIPQGQILGNEEMENLVNELFLCSNVNYTPDGKPILAILKQQDIERLFM